MKQDKIYSMRLGEFLPEDIKDDVIDILEKPVKIVARSVTLQDKNGVQMEATLKHPDFIEEDKE